MIEAETSVPVQSHAVNTENQPRWDRHKPRPILSMRWTKRQRRRFWSRIDKDGPVPAHRPKLGPCWIWSGSKNGEYGKFRGRFAHRISHAFTRKRDTELFICHKCDNPSCVNPRHLFTGTNQENLRDMYLKGRAWCTRRPKAPKKPRPTPKPRGARGVLNGSAKLTEENVRELRILRKNGAKYRELAALYSVSIAAVIHTVQGKTWRHVV